MVVWNCLTASLLFGSLVETYPTCIHVVWQPGSCQRLFKSTQRKAKTAALSFALNEEVLTSLRMKYYIMKSPQLKFTSIFAYKL